MGLGPVQGTESLSRGGSSPNLVTKLSCDFVWVFPLWEPQSPIPMARDKSQRICCLQVWGILPGLRGSLSSFQSLLQGSPGLEPHILSLHPSTRNHLHSYPTACSALDPEPPGSFYHVDSMTTSQRGPLSSHATDEDPEVRRKTGVQSLDSSQSINQHLDTKLGSSLSLSLYLSHSLSLCCLL